MELGEGTLRRSGGNFLLRAIHSRHGLVWSDGQNVFLSPIAKTDDKLLQSSPIKLGEFDGIISLSWSCDFPGGWCYLCVVQTQKVSIWRVEGSAPSLKLKLVRKISKTPLPQGCLWNPVRDILSISTKEQTSLYFRHTDKKSSLSLTLPVGTTIKASCWSEKGDRMCISSDKHIWIYSWNDIDMKFKDFTTNQHSINSGIGNIRCMMSIGQEYLLLTSELPLEDLVKQTKLADQLDMNLAIQSPTSTLFNLTSSTQTQNCSSKLIMLSLRDDLQIISNENLVDILTPDLLTYHFNGSVQSVIVGSNSQSTLKYYNITSLGAFTHQHDIILPDSDRSKGLTPVPHSDSSVYILVGKTRSENSAFLNTSNDMKYQLRLTIAQLMSSNDRDKICSEDSLQTSLDSANLTKLLPKIPNSEGSHTEGSNTRDGGSPSIMKKKSASVPLLSTEDITPDNSSGSETLADTIGDRNKRLSINDNTAVSSNSSIWSRNITQSENSLIQQLSPKPLNTDNAAEVDGADRVNDDELIFNLERDIIRHDMLLSVLRERVENLTESLEEINMISTCRYQQLNNPEFVHVEYYTTIPELSAVPAHKQSFLTDRGRLKLETLLHIFNTNYLLIQLHADCPPLVLTSNIDGYIPLRFETGQTYRVFSETSNQANASSLNIVPQLTAASQNITSQLNCSQSVRDATLPSDNSSLNGRTAHSPEPQKPPRDKNSDTSKVERLDKLKQFLANDTTGEALYRLKTAAHIKKSSSSEQLENGARNGRSADARVDVTYNL